MTLVTTEDLARMKQEILQATAPSSIMKDVDASTKFRRLLGADMAIGRSLIGPQWIDEVAIQNGAVVADKLEAQLVLSTSIIAGAASPADRLELDATGLHAFGTVSATPNTETFALENDGSFTFGVSPNQITFTASSGVLTVPAAVITSLTIADVGSGVVGGNYDTGASNPKLRLSTAGIEMWNSGGTKTVSLNSADGSFTLSNDPAGANRITITEGGIELWKSSTRQFYLQAGGATNAITMLLTGPGVSDYIGMNPTDGLWLGASTFAGASGKFRVFPSGTMEATGATISGAITATSGTLQSLSVTGNLTLSGSGLFRTGSSNPRLEIDTSGLFAYSSGGTQRAKIGSDGSGFLGASTTLAWTTGGTLTLAGFTANSTTLSSGSGGSFVTMSSGSTAFSAGGATPASAPFNVSSAGALAASSLVITGAATFSGGSLTLPNGGTITSSVVDINGNGGGSPGNFGNMTIDGTLTLASGGSIVDADGSVWDQSGITLFSPSSQGDTILWKYSGWGSNRPYGTISSVSDINGVTQYVEAYYGTGAVPQSTGAILSLHAESNIGITQVIASGNAGVNSTKLFLYDHATAANSYMEFTVRGREVAQFDYTNRTLSLNGYLYPGDGTNQQANASIRSGGTHLDMHLSDAAGSSGLRVLDSGGTVVWLVNSDGQMSLPGSDLSAAGTYYGRVPVAFNGLTKYIHLFNA